MSPCLHHNNDPAQQAMQLRLHVASSVENRSTITSTMMSVCETVIGTGASDFIGCEHLLQVHE